MPLALIVARETLLLLLACGGAIALRRASASLRHLLWLGVIVGVLLIPILSPAPRLRLAILPTLSSTASGATHAPAWMIVAWGVGTLMVAGWLVAGVVGVRGVVRAAAPVDSAEWSNALASAARELRMETRPKLRVSGRVDVAFVFGPRSPTIVLPLAAHTWPAAHRRMVLLHELAHVSRHDLSAQAIASIACALNWFNPLVWVAALRLRVEGERACDALVLDQGVRSSEYAQYLLDMARDIGVRPVPAALTLAVIRPNEFERRLVAILNHSSAGNARRHPPALSLLGVVALATVSVAFIAPVSRPVARRGVPTLVVKDRVGLQRPPSQPPRAAGSFATALVQETETRPLPITIESSLPGLSVLASRTHDVEPPEPAEPTTLALEDVPDRGAMVRARESDDSAPAPSNNRGCKAQADGAQSVAQSLGISGGRYERGVFMHFPTDGSAETGEISQERLLISLCRAPALSFGLALGNGENMNFVTGEPIALARQDPHHALLSIFGGEVQWRPVDAGIFNAVVTAAFGRMDASWQYLTALPPAGVTRRTHTASSAAYGVLGVGYELHLFTYVRAGLIGGAQFQTALATPGLDARPFQGPFLGGMLSVGK